MSNDEYYTPPEILSDIRRVLGGIDFDPCSCELAQENVRALRFFTKDEDALSKPVREWYGDTFMNPPFSMVSEFVNRLVDQMFIFKTIRHSIVFGDNCTETKWFRTLWEFSRFVHFPSKRISFIGEDGKKKLKPVRGQAIFLLTEGDEKHDRITFFERIFSPQGIVTPTRGRL